MLLNNHKYKQFLNSFLPGGALLLSFAHVQNANSSGVGAINYGKTAVGSRYIFGGSNWDPSNRSYGGTDCAGLVLKSWKWPVEIPYKSSLQSSYVVNGKSVPGKLWTGHMLLTSKYNLPWTNSKDYGSASKGDAFTYNNGSQGHTFLYLSDSNGVASTLEAKGRAYGVGYFSRTFAKLKASNYFLQKKKGSLSGNQSDSSIRVGNRERNENSSTSPRENRPTEPRVQKKFHILRRGETLATLAKQYKVPKSHLEKLNKKKVDKGLKVGMILQVS